MDSQYSAARHFAAIGGSRMSYLDVGQGEAVLLAHGFLWDARLWNMQIALLSRRYRVIAPDLWGHGQSGPMPIGTASLFDIADQHRLLLDRLGIQRCAIVGMSVGGMWGAELALSHPSRVTALALLNTYLGSEQEPMRETCLSMLAAVEAAGAVPDAIADKLIPLFFSPTSIATHSALINEFRGLLRNPARDMVVDTLVPLGRMIFQRRNALPDLANISAETFVMSGAHDVARPPYEGREMADILGCGYDEIPDAGHSAPLENPQSVNERLSDFLGRTLSRAE